MTGNSVDSSPLTPFPDSSSHSGDDPASPPVQPPVVPKKPPLPPALATSSEDDLSLLLAQPDPFLDDAANDASAGQPAGGSFSPAEISPPEVEREVEGEPTLAPESMPRIDGTEPTSVFTSLPPSENEFQLPAIFSPSPDAPSPDALTPRSLPVASSTPSEEVELQQLPRTAWPLLIVASYASAVTLALFWILWTGRGLPHPRSVSDAIRGTGLGGPESAPSSRKSSPPAARLPARNLTGLNSPARLGDLEVIPLSISLREIELVRLDGFSDETRQVDNVLVLSLRLTNRSRDQSFAPLEPSFVRNASLAQDDSFIETASGRRLPMYQLAPESEWSIRDQQFATLKPGEEGETIVVSDPVPAGALEGPSIWHLKVRTGTYQTDVLGIQFSRQDVAEGF